MNLEICFLGPNHAPQLKVEGETQIKGAKRAKDWGPRKILREGVWERARGAPHQKIVEKSNFYLFIYLLKLHQTSL